MKRKPINYEKESYRHGYVLEFNKHIKIIQESQKQLYCTAYDKETDEDISFALDKIYECGTGSGVLYCTAYSSSEPIKVEYINGIKVGSRKFGFGGKVDEYTDKDYSEFLAKRFKRIISIDIYEKEESS